MRFRDQVALTLPALVLRLVLAIVFLWAGIGKFADTTTVTGDDAARLSNMGVHLVSANPDISEPQLPLNELPEPDAAPAVDPDASTSADTDEEPLLDDSADEQRLQEILDEAKRRAEEAKENATEQLDDLTETVIPESPAPAGATDPADDGTLGLLELSYTMLSVQQTTTKATASDFPDPMRVRNVYRVALMLDRCADPGLTAESQPINPILPSWLAGPWAKYFAIAAAVTEIAAGFLLLIGFMTRFSALGTFVVMLVAMWTTQIGPASLQSVDPLLGFLPNYGSLWSYEYKDLMFQLSCAAMSIAVFFLGSGPIGMDRVIFGASKRDKYIHGDPKSAPAQAARDPFDRSPNPTP